ncbi:MAG TPA: MMPL family transporter [Solirubrobacteraceae bacterium]|nr:MMPL family transporter [Solirubrobacteraceae bacterium]
MRRLAKFCFTQRKFVALGWVVALIGLTALHSAVGSAYSDNFRLSGTQSFDAVNLLERNAPSASGDTEKVVIAVDQGRVTDPAVRSQVQSMLTALARQPHVTEISSPYGPRGAAQISPSGKVAFANATFDVQANKVTAAAAKAFVNAARAGSGHGVEIEVEGQVAQAANQQGAGGLPFGFLAAGIVLFIVFGSFLAMLLPLVTAGLSLGTGVAVIGLLSHVIQMASFSNELSLLIGLGVGVDYALFIVTRYRQGLLRGLTGEEAIVESVDTSGRAVLFAGMIVCIAMLGMFALGVSFLYGVAVATSIAVAFTVVASLTLLPALLGFFGLRVLRRRDRRALKDGNLRTTDESAGWARWVGWMQQRPAVFAAVAAGVLVLLAIPFFSMRLGSADPGSDPAGTTTRKAYDLLAKGFGPGYNGPLQLVAQISGPAQESAFVRLEHEVAATPGVVGATRAQFIPSRAAGRPGVALADVYPKGSPQDASTSNLLHTVRDTVVPAAERGTGLHVLVGGQTAIFDDFATVLSRKLPLFLTIVIGLSFLLLMTVFRSVVIPAIAAAMNLLSAAAAFGVVTLVFQDGVGASLLGIDKTGPIEAFVPVFMFAILFGLSMDYEVFLVTRIYEEWHRRRNNREAVAHGLAATGRTITAAAAIMVLVFGSFILGGQRIIDLFGVGLASAVLLDALIVRSVLVPALMLIVGDANWWLPSWLDRILPHLRVEGSSARGALSDTVAPDPAVAEPEPVAG